MDVFDAITSWRSVRRFTAKPVSDDFIKRILEAGRWAQSGLNNQPWRFSVIKEKKLKDAVAANTKYGFVVKEAPACIAVFLNTQDMYDRTKDVQAVGACIQNMLRAAHDLGLGAVWLGEILTHRVQVEKMLGVPEYCELMALIAVGWPAENPPKAERKDLSELVL